MEKSIVMKLSLCEHIVKKFRGTFHHLPTYFAKHFSMAFFVGHEIKKKKILFVRYPLCRQENIYTYIIYVYCIGMIGFPKGASTPFSKRVWLWIDRNKYIYNSSLIEKLLSQANNKLISQTSASKEKVFP